jgi:ssDNA thymidine ADP-ribosyltransferase DarT-like protein
MIGRPTIPGIMADHDVTRVCHFTPSRNLPHILRDGEVRATKDLAEDVRAVYTATDLDRLDGHPDKVCCTIEYPNAYYWNKARAKGEAPLFPTWVVLLIDAAVLFRPGTLFCTGNASKGFGATARAGADGLLAAYAPAVTGSGDRTFTRGPSHLPASPTDLQAEVLVPGPIPLTDVLAIAVATVEQAATERAILSRLSHPVGKVKWMIAPLMFQPTGLAAAIQAGRRPPETFWSPPEEPAHG